MTNIEKIGIDASYYGEHSVPGRSQVHDPYNAPTSAVSANFNTAYVTRDGRHLESAETQTPLTDVVKRLIADQVIPVGSKAERINLVSPQNSQLNFGQILKQKIQRPEAAVAVGQKVPSQAQLIYRHHNSHRLEKILRGMMMYSNNFIANQLFLNLVGERVTVNFLNAAERAALFSQEYLAWEKFKVLEGAGLSRENRLNAWQIQQLLDQLRDHVDIFTAKLLGNGFKASVKTGTLNGVSNYAGYIFPDHETDSKRSYQFVFMFNRPVPYDYRNAVLESLAKQIEMYESE
jgi:D-alanyl-D-alanine carboxypeptidase/D-alanyl-D-alanine-endopeptidase (penicillin-binding protein 4)